MKWAQDPLALSALAPLTNKSPWCKVRLVKGSAVSRVSLYMITEEPGSWTAEDLSIYLRSKAI
jgi:hypothetical protein